MWVAVSQAQASSRSAVTDLNQTNRAGLEVLVRLPVQSCNHLFPPVFEECSEFVTDSHPRVAISNLIRKFPSKQRLLHRTNRAHLDRMAHWHGGRSGQWPEYPPTSHDEGDPSMHSSLPQPGQWNTVPASSLSHPAGNTFPLQEPAGDSQHQPGIITPDSSHSQYPAGNTFPLQEPAGGSQHQPGIITHETSHSQYPVGGSYQTLEPQLQFPTGHAFQQEASNQFHHGTFDVAQTTPQGPTLPQTSHYLTSFNPTTSQGNVDYDYRNPQYAATSLHEPEYSNYQTMHSQGPAHVSHQNLQFEPQSSMVGSYQPFVSQDFHDSSVPHHTFQFPTALHPTDPSTSQGALTQSTFPAFGADTSHDRGHPPSSRPKDLIKMLVEKRPVHQRVKRAHQEIQIMSSTAPSATRSTRKNSPLQIDSLLVDYLKEDSATMMNSLLFQNSLYPATDAIDTLADRALDDAIAKHKDNAKELKKWKSRQEGQSTLGRLKGLVKKVHRDSQGCARGLVIGVYNLSLQVLFKNMDDVVPSRKWDASVLLLNDDYLDSIVQRITNDGQVQSIRIPFGNAAVIGTAEYILIDQGYHRYIFLHAPDWEVALKNMFALAAAICDWVIRRCSRDGLFQNADFHSLESEVSYLRMTNRMESLVGNDKVEFYGLLFSIRLPPNVTGIVHAGIPEVLASAARANQRRGPDQSSDLYLPHPSDQASVPEPIENPLDLQGSGENTVHTRDKETIRAGGQRE
ncbi:uncharacterized protein HD556DRAFT_1310645 [Suillus plorans]|uniref:Uncharacterized protein n=1 Tax=Suillus plorans TaxID=116603 RepID=A0A9P7AIZ7_9AGAM|nr:uncharacterized protein HD556DRAFT_1310645 [Suillus plorans]KAG1790437.1 hypothetical protein HD556DRAFT_1310645 [Suillus plorans]